MESNKQEQLALTTSNAPVTISGVGSLVAIRQDKARFPRYRDIPVAERQKWLAKEFRLLASIARVKDYDPKDALVGAVALDERIADSPELSDLTIPEMEYAFKNGVFGRYNEYYGLSAISLYSFLEGFVKSELKADATKAVRASKAEEYQMRMQLEEEAERRRLRAEIEQAKRDGTFVPTGRFDFSGAVKSVNAAIDTSEHRARIARQAQEIFARRNKS